VHGEGSNRVHWNPLVTRQGGKGKPPEKRTRMTWPRIGEGDKSCAREEHDISKRKPRFRDSIGLFLTLTEKTDVLEGVATTEGRKTQGWEGIWWEVQVQEELLMRGGLCPRRGPS